MAMILILSLLLLMLLLLAILLFFAYKPWRFFFTAASSSFKAGELERPLVAEDINVSRNQSTELPGDCDLEGACYPNKVHFCLLQTHGLVYKQRTPAVSLHSNVPQGSCLMLEVIDGPSRGLRCSAQSTNTSRLPLTSGRVSPSDLLIKDSEVSGKHALIKWNLDKMKWELVDMGSLNGTLLNSRAINHADIGSRDWSDPADLDNGDVVTLGTTSKVIVHITRKISSTFPLEWVWHQILWLCVEEGKSCLWKMFAIVNGLCLGWVSLDCLAFMMGMVEMGLPNLLANFFLR